jgi:23S rRNA (adenine2503-C2)-methyltransferase
LTSAINFITSNRGLGISPKRITISTAGIAKMIKKLGDDNSSVNLAISLHSGINDKRNELMPLNKKINLEELKESICYYYEKTKKRITYEYILFKNINDSIFDARKLADFAKISPCKINLIEYNSVENIPFQKSTNQRTVAFIKFLENCNLIVNLRRSKGGDIDAACGQLVNKLN